MGEPDNSAIINTPLPSKREAPDPVLEKYIALINNNENALTPAQRREYIMIIADRFVHIANEREQEDYGKHINKYLSYVFRIRRDGEGFCVIKPGYQAVLQPESIPAEMRVNFTPFRVSEKEARCFIRK